MKPEKIAVVLVILATVGIVYVNLDNPQFQSSIQEGLYYVKLLVDGFADLASPLISRPVMMGEYVETGDLQMTISECELLESSFAEEGAAYLLVHVKVRNIGKVPATPPLLIDMRLHYLDEVIRPKKSWRVPDGRRHYDPLTTDKIYPDVTKEGWVCFEVPKKIDLSEVVISARCEGRRVKWALNSS